jgi:hypothetical protein
VAVFGDAALFILFADDEAVDVLQKEQRDAPTVAELDELGGFFGAFGKKDTVVGQNAHRVAVDVGPAGNQGGSVQLLEFEKFTAVHHAGNHFPDVVGNGQVGGTMP